MTTATSPFIEEIPWWRRFFFEQAKFVSALSRAECVRRLKEAVDPWWSGGKKPAIGRVTDTGAVMRRRVWYHNAFQTIAVVKFEETGVGTRINVSLGPRVIVVLLTLAWFLMLIAFGAGFAMSEVGGTGMDISKLPFILGPMILAIGGAVAVMIGRRLARNDRQFLIDLIRNTLSATEA